MSENDLKLYETGRKSSGLTQEAAAELLHVTPRRLSEYESGRIRVPDDIALAMSEAYGDPLLIYRHLRQRGPGVIPEVARQNLSCAALDLLSRLRGFGTRHQDDRLMEIARGDVVHEWDRDDFTAILDDVDGIVGAALSLKYAKAA